MRQQLQYAAPRQDRAEIGVESARTIGNRGIGAAACLGFSMRNHDVATTLSRAAYLALCIR